VDDSNGSVWGVDTASALWYSAKGDGSDWASQALTGVLYPTEVNWITARNGLLWLGAGAAPGTPAGRVAYSLAAFGGKFISNSSPPFETPVSIDKDGTMVGVYLYGTSYYYTPAASAASGATKISW